LKGYGTIAEQMWRKMEKFEKIQGDNERKVLSKIGMEI
jgi:hypothetical protein